MGGADMPRLVAHAGDDEARDIGADGIRGELLPSGRGERKPAGGWATIGSAHAVCLGDSVQQGDEQRDYADRGNGGSETLQPPWACGSWRRVWGIHGPNVWHAMSWRRDG